METKSTKKPKALNNTNHIVSWTIQGLEFGYPPCCVGEFIIHCIRKSWNTRGTRKFNGTGYVPCIKCNELPEEELLAYIEDHRRIATPFPDDGLRLPLRKQA